jgi:predicted site-specific integrase-resolvase
MSRILIAKDFVSIKEASIITGIQPQTLRKMGDQKQINCYRTHSGQRKFHKPSLEAMCYGDLSSSSSSSSHPSYTASISQPNSSNKINFIYTRVSCNRLHEQLDKQLQYILNSNESYKNYQPVSDISTSTNFRRGGLQIILKACFQKNVGEVVVKRRDRLCIIGYDLLEQIILIHGGKIIVVDEETKCSAENDTIIIHEIMDVLQNFYISHKKISDEHENIILSTAIVNDAESYRNMMNNSFTNHITSAT